MKRLMSLAALALITVTTTTPAFAQLGYGTNGSFNTNGYFNRDGRFGNGTNGQFGQFSQLGTINATQAQLQARITAGIRSGALTQNEASQLRRKLAKMNQVEMRMRVSGRGLSLRERQKLTTQLAQLASEIDLQINDAERRRIGFRGNRGWSNNNNWR